MLGQRIMKMELFGMEKVSFSLVKLVNNTLWRTYFTANYILKYLEKIIPAKFEFVHDFPPTKDIPITFSGIKQFTRFQVYVYIV